MGISVYEYNDTYKTDIQEIKNNEKENNDFKTLNQLMNKFISKNNLIPSEFKFLTIKILYLGLNSAEDIYNKYTKEFEKRGLKKKDSVHASFLFNFSDDCNYFIDYFPNKCDSTYSHLFKDEDKGIRYKNMSFEDFIHKNDICIIKLKSNKSMTFYQFLENIFNSNKWKYENYDLETNNCCHFGQNSLSVLDANIEDKLNDILFTQIIKKSKEASIEELIPEIFLTIFR